MIMKEQIMLKGFYSFMKAQSYHYPEQGEHED
jgi:hypothetical protein